MSILLGIFLITFVIPAFAGIVSYKISGASSSQAVLQGFISGSKLCFLAPQIIIHPILFPLRPVYAPGWFVLHWERWGRYTGPPQS